MALGVMIIESLGPREFFHGRLDGRAVSEVLRVIGVRHEYRIGLDLEYFKRAMRVAVAQKPKFLHLSAHGNEDGIGLGDGSFVSWDELAPIVAPLTASSIALCLSTCAGATTSKLLREVVRLKKTFPYLIGSSDVDGLSFADSCVAWSIFYKTLLERKDLDTKARVKEAVDSGNKATGASLRYYRYDGTSKSYKKYGG